MFRTTSLRKFIIVSLEMYLGITACDTVLLKYFVGEKPLQMSQISRKKFDPLRSNYYVLARIVCIY